MNVRFDPVRRLRGEIEPPADKSISHRAAILGAMNAEPVRITNYLEADDTISTLNAMRALGALVEQRSRGGRHPRRRAARGARCRRRRSTSATRAR